MFSPKRKLNYDKDITHEDLDGYRETASRGSEVRAYGEVMNNLVKPRRDLTDQEVQVVMEELEAKSSMILMIFRFFLQSSEYPFFIRRLKNVVMTKASFKSFAPPQDASKEDHLSRPQILSQSVIASPDKSDISFAFKTPDKTQSPSRPYMTSSVSSSALSSKVTSSEKRVTFHPSIVTSGGQRLEFRDRPNTSQPPGS